MKKILILLFVLACISYEVKAQKSSGIADTIVAGSIEKSCPGGFEAFRSYIKKNVRAPAIAYENRKTGTTYVSFIIEADGSVSHVCTILAVGSGMDEEVVRVINNSSGWSPIIIDNKPVRAFCRVGVQFFADFNKHSMWVDAKQFD